MSDGVRLVDTMNYMGQWVAFGDDASDPYISFMAYWVAFNMAYAPYRRKRSATDKWEPERDTIERFFRKKDALLSQYDPFAKGDADLFSSTELYRLYDLSEYAIEKKRSAIRNGNVIELIKAVYTVRCNFFHGNKKLGDETDRRFVTQSLIIVRGYLDALGIKPVRKFCN